MAAPEHETVRSLVSIEDGITRTALFDHTRETAHSVRILDVHLDRRHVTDGRHGGIDLQHGTTRHHQKAYRQSNQQRNKDNERKSHFFVQLSIQSMKFLYQNSVFCGFRTQWPSSGNTMR